MTKKVFGYPEFDQEGEEILCTYDNAYSDMLMDIRVYRMRPGQKRSFCRQGEEIAVLLLSGTVAFGWEGRTETVSRKDVFTEGPYAVHVCTGKEITVEAGTDAEILVQCTKNDTAFAGKLYRPEDAPWVYSSVGKFGNVAKRRVNTIFDKDIAPWSNMVLGEVLNDRATGPGTCPTGIPSRSAITSNSTGPRASVPALWGTTSSRAWTTASPPSPAAACTPRRWHPASRCTPAG